MKPKTDAKYIVGVSRWNYPEKRNIPLQIEQKYSTKKVLDYYRILNAVKNRVSSKANYSWTYSFRNFGLSKVDLYHFFNQVSFGKTPWVSTFEYEIPRSLMDSRKHVELLLRDSCKKLIAMSDTARSVEEWFLSDKYPDLAEEIMSKVTVLHPPQGIYNRKIENKPVNDRFTATFVGNAFYHKGGVVLLRSLENLVQQGVELELNIVSNFTLANWFDTSVNDETKVWVRNFMDTNSNWISHFRNIDQMKVSEILYNSDISILPSFGETYGYVVLESQACGTPVITTNSWAFTEINNDSCGWLLNLPTRKVAGGLRGDFSNSDEQEDYAILMQKELETTLLSILNNKEEIKSKGVKAQERILMNHDPALFKSRMERIYDEAIQV